MFLTDALRSGVTVSDIESKYFIKTRRHGKYPNLVLFKYDQISSPMGDPLVQEARGIILDEANNWAVVARPFDKFFNAEEGYAAEIDWSTARFFEKLDGSICTVYYYGGEWHVATSGTPDAASQVNDYGFSFAELFWKVFYANGYKVPEDKNVCLMFELMTPYNRVVVRHDFNRLVLIGARDLTSMLEVSVDNVSGYETVRSFDLTSLSAAVASFKEINPLNQEGYVVVDAKFNRIKVKHPGYVALHHMKSGMSMRRILEVVRAGEVSEVIAHFPEYSDAINKVQAAIDTLRSTVAADYERCKHETDRKAFAMLATKTAYPDALFSIFSKKASSADDWVANLRNESLYDRLGLKESKEEVQ